jgi:hypothetical protein
MDRLGTAVADRFRLRDLGKWEAVSMTKAARLLNAVLAEAMERHHRKANGGLCVA